MTTNTHSIEATLTEGPIGKTLIRLTGPMVWGMLAIISINLIDTFFIARLGKEQLAAMSFCLPVIMLLMCLSLGQCIGTGSVISRAIGKEEVKTIKQLTTHSLVLIFLTMMFFCVLGIATIEPLFKLFNASTSVILFIHDYMKIWYIGLPAMGLAMVGNTALTSNGNVRLPAIIMFIAAILNFALDPILIYGLFGFPRMEMEGAALATVIAYFVAFFVSFWGLTIQSKMIAYKTSVKEMIHSFKCILSVSVPASASQVIVPLTSALTIWMLSGFGADVVAGYGIVSRLEAFAMIFIIGLSTALAPFVGQNWGAKLYTRVSKSVYIGYRIALGWGVASAFILAVGSTFIPSLFNDDPLVIATVSVYLLTVPLSYGAVGCLFVTNAFLNTIGMSGTVALITIVRYFVLYVPMSLFAMRFFGPQGVFMAISLTNIITSLGAYFVAKRILSIKSEVC